jgi:hypothetical protein
MSALCHERTSCARRSVRLGGRDGDTFLFTGIGDVRHRVGEGAEALARERYRHRSRGWSESAWPLTGRLEKRTSRFERFMPAYDPQRRYGPSLGDWSKPEGTRSCYLSRLEFGT